MVTWNNVEKIYLNGLRNSYQEGPLVVIEIDAYTDMHLVDGNPFENIDLVADPGKTALLS